MLSSYSQWDFLLNYIFYTAFSYLLKKKKKNRDKKFSLPPLSPFLLSLGSRWNPDVLLCVTDQSNANPQTQRLHITVPSVSEDSESTFFFSKSLMKVSPSVLRNTRLWLFLLLAPRCALWKECASDVLWLVARHPSDPYMRMFASVWSEKVLYLDGSCGDKHTQWRLPAGSLKNQNIFIWGTEASQQCPYHSSTSTRLIKCFSQINHQESRKSWGSGRSLHVSA